MQHRREEEEQEEEEEEQQEEIQLTKKRAVAGIQAIGSIGTQVGGRCMNFKYQQDRPLLDAPTFPVLPTRWLLLPRLQARTQYGTTKRLYDIESGV